MILAVTGGRHTAPAKHDLPALWAACLRRGVRVVRVGCCPTGVDAAVWRSALAFARRMWALERWVADWRNETGRMPGEPRKGSRGEYWPAAGMLRNRGMARGDQGLVARVEGPRGVKAPAEISAGPISVLVHWPGGTGTAGMIKEGEAVRARLVAIGDLRG